MNKTNWFDRLTRFFWLSMKAADKDWDKLLNSLLDKGEVTNASAGFWIEFEGKYKVWTANHPYASGALYITNTGAIGLQGCLHCTKSTRIRLEDFVNAPKPDSKEEILKAEIREELLKRTQKNQ